MKTAQARLCDMVVSTYILRKIFGVADGILIDFINVVYWMYDWVEKIL